MAEYVKRVQIPLTAEEHHALGRISAESEEALSLLVREAIERIFFRQAPRA